MFIVVFYTVSGGILSGVSVLLFLKGTGSESRARICKRLRSPGIDSDNSIPPAYVAWRAGATNRVVVPARQARNRFLGSLKGLQIRAQHLKRAVLYICGAWGSKRLLLKKF